MFILSANIILAQCAIVPFYAPNGVSRWRRMSGESPQVTRPAFTALKPFWWLNNLLLTASLARGWSAKLFGWGEFFAQCFSDFRVGHGSKTNIESGS